MTDTSGIAFLSSTTTTTVDRGADAADTKTSVIHAARFAIEPGTIPDRAGKFSTWVFRPLKLTVEWRDGRLDRVVTSGPRVLKGGLSKRGTNGDWWRARRRDSDGHLLFDRAELPDVITDRIDEYEAEVASAHLVGIVDASHTRTGGGK